MSTVGSRPCKACGVEIFFVESDATGKTLPLQRVKSVYTIGLNGKAHALPKDVIGRDRWISHWETCPGTEQIKRQQREAKGET